MYVFIEFRRSQPPDNGVCKLLLNLDKYMEHLDRRSSADLYFDTSSLLIGRIHHFCRSKMWVFYYNYVQQIVHGVQQLSPFLKDLDLIIPFLG